MKKRTLFHSLGQYYYPGQRVITTTKSRQRKSWSQPLGTAMMGLSVLVFCSTVSGQAVPLGEAAKYTIVSSQGVTSAGLTVVNGDIALSPLTTITGFTPPGPGLGIVNGTIHYNDASAMLAQSNALTAYNTLAGLAYLPANNLTGQDLGGKSLSPGVYHFNTSVGLTGNLTLNTFTDPNAVFVFQIGSTLTTAVNSSIVVTGAGAGIAPNIFWQVGSSATLNTGSAFTGNILAYASVSLGTGATVTNGRLIALNGAVTLLGNTVSAPAAPEPAVGRFWNGYANTLWSGLNWSSTEAGTDQLVLVDDADVVFSIDPDAPSANPQNQNTELDIDYTISSLTVNDTAAVTIGGDNKLTISATGLITGINVNSGAGFFTIGSDLELGYLSQVIAVNNEAGMLVSGVISGTNGLTKAGTGVLTLTGTETYTGATVVSEGTLQLGDGVTPGASIASSDSVLVSPDGILAINLADGETFSENVTDNGQIQWIAEGTNTQASTSVFSGTGSMLVTAPGTTILLGDNTFTGGTTIDTSGDVLVGNPNSNTSSPFGTGVLTIIDGTIDTVEIPLAINFAALAFAMTPSDTQLLQIEVGGYVQSGGQINMHLEGTEIGDYTRYLVTGTADLSGGTVFVYDRSGNYVPSGGDEQNIINTTGGLEGEFASNFPQSEFYNEAFDQTFYYEQGNTLLYPTITYDDDNAYVTWVQDSFQSVPDLTPNQDNVGGALDENLPDDVADYLNGQDIDDLPALYDLIAPDELTAIFQMGFTTAGQQYGNIERHLSRVRNGSTRTTQTTQTYTDSKGGLSEQTVTTQDSSHWNLFFEANGGSVSVDPSRNASGYDFDTEGGVIGADKRLSDTLVVGVLGYYGKSDASLVNGGSIEGESYGGAVYATIHNDGWYLDMLLGAGYNTYDTRRAALLGFAEGSPDGWQLNSMINTGYDFRRGNWILSPNASLAYTRVTLNSFEENGSLAPLEYPDQHQESLRSEIGFTVAYVAKFNGMAITPQVRLAWQHEFMDSTQAIQSRFASGPGSTFSVDGPSMDRDRAVLSAGLSVQVNESVTIYAYYDGQLGSSDYSSDQVTAGVNIAF